MRTADGCSVEVYTLLPPAGEAELVHDAVPPGASVLDLGCGTGRIAHRLAELGHPVTAVDDSAEMLAHVRTAKVRSRIEDLALDTRFDVVLLASHLINSLEPKPLLDTVARHLAPGGRAVFEWHPPEWIDTVADGDGGRLGEVRIELHGVERDGELLRAVVRYSAHGRSWDQPFTGRRLDLRKLDQLLRHAGLRRLRSISPDGTWLVASPC